MSVRVGVSELGMKRLSSVKRLKGLLVTEKVSRLIGPSDT
jgi:hypothetical protein